MTDETLLATEPTPSTDATTQSAPAQSDEQAASEQQPVETTPPAAEETTKPEGEAKAEPTEPESKEDKGEAKAEEQREGAPERYEAFKAPKGMPESFELGEGVTKAFGEVAKALDLPQDKAQSILDGVFPAMLAQEQAMEAKFRDLAQHDSRIGGEKFEENLATAKKVVEAFDKNGLGELLNGPLGSHPDLIAALVAAHRDVSEDSFVGGKPGSGSVDYTDDASLGAALKRAAAKQQQ